MRCLRKTSSKVCTKTDYKVPKTLRLFAMYHQELSGDCVAPSYDKIEENGETTC